MARSVTISQVNRLGERLARSTTASSEDRGLLQHLIAEYSGPMATVQDRISGELGLASTARPKTEKTTIEKLRRDRTRLSKMQDLVGVRIVGIPTLDEQDKVVQSICELFPGAHVVDHRDRPDGLYRAVHVIPVVDGCPVEIQVRTQLQHAWADVYERLADATDRRIRYGAIPRDPAARRLYDLLLEIGPMLQVGEPQHARIVRDLAEGKMLKDDVIREGPGTASPEERGARSALLRRMNRRLKRLEGEVRAGEGIAARLLQIGKDIREGHRRFERGIVE